MQIRELHVTGFRHFAPAYRLPIPLSRCAENRSCRTYRPQRYRCAKHPDPGASGHVATFHRREVNPAGAGGKVILEPEHAALQLGMELCQARSTFRARHFVFVLSRAASRRRAARVCLGAGSVRWPDKTCRRPQVNAHTRCGLPDIRLALPYLVVEVGRFLGRQVGADVRGPTACVAATARHAGIAASLHACQVFVSPSGGRAGGFRSGRPEWIFRMGGALRGRGVRRWRGRGELQGRECFGHGRGNSVLRRK